MYSLVFLYAHHHFQYLKKELVTNSYVELYQAADFNAMQCIPNVHCMMLIGRLHINIHANLSINVLVGVFADTTYSKVCAHC